MTVGLRYCTVFNGGPHKGRAVMQLREQACLLLGRNISDARYVVQSLAPLSHHHHIEPLTEQGTEKRSNRCAWILYELREEPLERRVIDVAPRAIIIQDPARTVRRRGLTINGSLGPNSISLRQNTCFHLHLEWAKRPRSSVSSHDKLLLGVNYLAPSRRRPVAKIDCAKDSRDSGDLRVFTANSSFKAPLSSP